jgi:hypothetical protein
MEAAAAALGMGGQLRYAVPANDGAEAVSSPAARQLGAQVYVDIHDNGKAATFVGDSAEQAAAWVETFGALNSSARLVVWETNTRRHDFSRVLLEATDINDLQGAPQRGNGAGSLRVDSRVESFCMEMSGHDDGLDSAQHFLGDQGMLFFLPVGRVGVRVTKGCSSSCRYVLCSARAWVGAAAFRVRLRAG